MTKQASKSSLPESVPGPSPKRKSGSKARGKTQPKTEAKPEVIEVSSEALTEALQGASPASTPEQPEQPESGLSKTDQKNIASAQASAQKAYDSMSEVWTQIHGMVDGCESSDELANIMQDVKAINGKVESLHGFNQQAESVMDARTSRDSIKQALSGMKSHLKAVTKLCKANARSEAKAEAEVKKQAEKARKQAARVSKTITEYEELKTLLETEIQALQGEEVNIQIIDVDMPQSMANVINAVADGLWASVTDGEVSIIPAEITLKTAKQKALMNQVIEAGYVLESEPGQFLFTEAGYSLLETTESDVKANFADMLANLGQSQAS